jgi:hypothetical protein
MNPRTLLFFAGFLCIAIFATAQDKSANPSLIITGKYWGVSKPLRDLPAMTPAEFKKMERKGEKRELNESLRKNRYYPFASTALPKGPDPAWQSTMGTTKGSKSPIVNFDAQTSPYYPPDCNGTAGPNHYMQTINTTYAIYDKTGTLLAGPTAINLIFGNVPGANRNDGDPIILYDEQADRWLVTEFSIPMSGTNYMLMAVSTTNDPTGTWHQYSFAVDAMPDYPKFAIWSDGYYMGDNNSGGNDIYVFEREQMLTGGIAHAMGFNNPNRPASSDGFMCVPPIDNDGAFAPSGSPGLYIAFNDDALGGGNDQLWIYELHADWTNIPASTFARTEMLDVDPFSADFGPNWNNIPQKGTGQKVDGIPQVVMNVPQYRNFGSYQTIVCCHTVNTDGNGLAGIRWYELRRTSGTWSVRQQGTYAPDTHCRWMGSIMLNGYDKIGLGYSISSTTMYPSIRYCGQSPAAYAAGSGILDIEEDTIFEGSNSQSGINRWGDYSLMAVDPVDDETFWFTTEYIGSGGSRKTRIASFKFLTGPIVTTVAATDITSASATLNGTINPQGSNTTYFFQYGTLPFNMGDSTAIDTAGSGSEPVDVNAVISGLDANKKYYYRLVGTNETGTTNGSTLNFTTSQMMTLSVVPPNQDVLPAPDSTHFTVTSNTDWVVSSDAFWCTATPSGTGNGTITAWYDENLLVDTRVANLTVAGTGVASQIVTVTQSGVAAILEVSPPNRDVTSPSGTTKFFVTSNTTWTVASDATWCTITPSGSGSDSITATFEENTVLTSRVANITVTAPGTAPHSVTVTQAGMAPILAVSPPNQDVTAAVGTTAFDVTSNTDWTAVSDASWCTVTPSGTGNGTIVADFAGNGTDQVRVATISVTAATLPVQTVTVSQARAGIGIDEPSATAIGIYPNPTRGVFRVVASSGKPLDMEVRVQDLKGQVVLVKRFSGDKEYTMDLSSQPEGGYHIIIKTSDQVIVKKLMIVK